MKITIDIAPNEVEELFERLGEDRIIKAVRATVADQIRTNLPTEERFRETVEAMVTMAQAIRPAAKRKRK